jgi:hypothetical protein
MRSPVRASILPDRRRATASGDPVGEEKSPSLPRPSAVGRGTIKWPSYPRAMFAFPFSEGSWMWHH